MKKMKKIIYKTDSQIKKIRESWKYLNELLLLIFKNAKEWIKLIELEKLAEKYIENKWVKWAFKWYMDFPANLCLSVNDCVVHWIPNEYKLKYWDLLKIDSWINLNWWISDSAVAKIIWWKKANPLWYKLLKSTKDALDKWIQQILPNKEIYYFSKTVYEHIIMNDFFVIKDLTWHWVWVNVHEWPYIFNYPHPYTKKIKFKKNMIIALEPITSINSETVYIDEKNWRNMYTKHWDLWAQREYMLLITENWIEQLSWIKENIYDF